MITAGTNYMDRKIKRASNQAFGLIGIAVFCTAIGAAPPSDPPALIGGPLVGYSSRGPLEVRAIRGVPGAAVFGDKISLPSDVVRVRVAPGEPYALLERSGSDPAALQLTGPAAGQAITIAGAARSADLAAFSPFGTTVVLFSQTAGRLQVLTGFPATPSVLREVETHSLPETPLALAVSDDGRSVLVSSATAIYLLSADGSTRTVTGTGGVAAMAFFPSKSDAALGDPQSGSVYRFQAQTGTASLRAVSAALKGLGAVGPSADGDTVYVLSPGTPRIASVRLSTGNIETLQMPVNTERLDRLGKTDDFLISSQPGAPTWIFAGQEKRAVFVPDSTQPRPRPRYKPMPAGGSR